MAIVDEKPDFSHVRPRIDANNVAHQPGGMPWRTLLACLLASFLPSLPLGGNVPPLFFFSRRPAVTLFSFAGGCVPIVNERQDFSHVSPKVEARNTSYQRAGVLRQSSGHFYGFCLFFSSLLEKGLAGAVSGFSAFPNRCYPFAGGCVAIIDDKPDFSHVSPRTFFGRHPSVCCFVGFLESSPCGGHTSSSFCV